MVLSAGGRTLRRCCPVGTAQVSSPLNFDFHCRGEKTKGRGVGLCRAVPGGVCTMLVSGKVREESLRQEGIFN